MRKLFEVVSPDHYGVINSWIAIRHDWREAHITIPWFGFDRDRRRRIGLGYKRGVGFYTLASWRELSFGTTTSNSTPGKGAAEAPGHALDLDWNDLKPFMRKHNDPAS